jgi:hypothetical protein
LNALVCSADCPSIASPNFGKNTTSMNIIFFDLNTMKINHCARTQLTRNFMT